MKMTVPVEARLLILETSGKTGLVAVAVGGRLLASRRLEETRRHARDLAPVTGELLARQGWKPRDLNAVIVSRGPGSYTGLRVGLMSAKVLAFATGCKLLSIDTFAAIALQAPAEVPAVDVLADAPQDRVYVQRYAHSGGEAWVPQTPLSIEPFPAWMKSRSADAWMTGPGLRVKGRNWPHEALVVASELWDPRPESLLEIGWALLQAGEADDFWSVAPLYLRPSAAETQWDVLQKPSASPS